MSPCSGLGFPIDSTNTYLRCLPSASRRMRERSDGPTKNKGNDIVKSLLMVWAWVGSTLMLYSQVLNIGCKVGC